jgi:hypothetical protein
MRVQQSQYVFEMARLPAIVRIQEGDDRGACLPDARVARRRGTSVWAAHNRHPPIDGADCGGRAVRRPVVDDDDLDIRAGLTESTQHGLDHGSPAFKGGDDDRDRRRAAQPCPFPAASHAEKLAQTRGRSLAG